jgi:hypothetical protein
MTDHPKPYRGCADPWKAKLMKLTKDEIARMYIHVCEQRDEYRAMLEQSIKREKENK